MSKILDNLINLEDRLSKKLSKICREERETAKEAWRIADIGANLELLWKEWWKKANCLAGALLKCRGRIKNVKLGRDSWVDHNPYE